MNTSDDSRPFDLVHELVTKQLEGSATEADQQQLAAAVTGDTDVRREYIEYMQETAHIASRLVHPQPTKSMANSQVLEAFDSADLAGTTHQSGRSFSPAIAVSAVVLLAASLAIWQVFVGQQTPATPTLIANQSHVATLIHSAGVVWDSQHRAVDELSRVSIGQKLCIHEGTLKLVFDSGVEALLLAPCLMEVQDRDRVYCTYGRIAAKAGPHGSGFVIDTPVARVTDLGTEFGVAISDSGETEVAVFEGEVDVELGSADQRRQQTVSTKREHLVQGQATRVGRDGRSRRIQSIDNQRLPGVRDLAPLHSKSPVIAAVRDNLSERRPESRMFYRIVHAGLREDCKAFVDRDHQWNGVSEDGIPTDLIGADYVMPFNDDKFADDLEVRVTVAQPATVYLFFNDNIAVPPWLADKFQDTGIDLGLDEAAHRFNHSRRLAVGPAASIDRTFSIWKCVVDEPQDLVLGSFERPDDVQLGYNMYGIAAVAQ
ncbi:FecR family protein [Allorhodopirellula solitaria]|uniref:FecR protein n=1 Tax=Allorhodopirellula solitaria TaxID=2527987 RepID=A0A5C5X1T8_9BACT|nr:FecR family protein [Allorhodopirellula solitaria]TWT56569.1 FecR protein [Allorhodopirellula solitaria]